MERSRDQTCWTPNRNTLAVTRGHDEDRGSAWTEVGPAGSRLTNGSTNNARGLAGPRPLRAGQLRVPGGGAGLGSGARAVAERPAREALGCGPLRRGARRA